MGVMRVEKRLMDELRVEVGMMESLGKKLVRIRLTWAGHVERMGDETMADAGKWRGKGGDDRNCDGGLH